MAYEYEKGETGEYEDWAFASKGIVHQSLFAQINNYANGVGRDWSRAVSLSTQVYMKSGFYSVFCNDVGGNVDRKSQTNSVGTDNLNFNLTASSIDTLTSKLASIECVPQAVTTRANYAGKQLAEDLNFIIKGIFDKYRITHLINLAYRDAMINGAGYLKIVKKENDFAIERVFTDEVIVDVLDGYYNDPYKMVHRKLIPKSVMRRLYPQFADRIDDCRMNEIRPFNSKNYTPSVLVLEAWCKNTYLDKGRHVICIENQDLVDEDWDKDYFPIIKCDYNEPVLGFLGMSVVDELSSIQKEIDRILLTMQSIMRLISVPRIFIDTNSQVNKNHITNKVGIMVEYDAKQGVAPIVNSCSAMPAELPAQLKFLIDQGYARVGLTPMDTQGQMKTSSGNQSGEALKKMTDIKAERWQYLQKNYEDKHVEVAELLLKELRGTKIKLKALDRVIGLKEMSTESIPNTDDSYVLKVFPVSALPDSIPDLIDTVTSMLRLGVIQPAQVPELFNVPDLDAFVAVQSAPQKLIDKELELMLEKKEYFNPEPYHDLNYAMISSMRYYAFAQLYDYSDECLKLLRRFINDVKRLLEQKGAENAAQQQSANGNPSAGTPAAAGQPAGIPA